MNRTVIIEILVHKIGPVSHAGTPGIDAALAAGMTHTAGWKLTYADPSNPIQYGDWFYSHGEPKQRFLQRLAAHACRVLEYEDHTDPLLTGLRLWGSQVVPPGRTLAYGWINPTGENPPGEAAPETAPCPHGEVSLQEAVELCIELYGGSWQSFLEKLERRGVRLMRVK